MKKLIYALLAIALVFSVSSSAFAAKKKVVVKPTPTPKVKCHPSYSGCLKADASDYDCKGGSGNGPYYTGKVKVIGPDVFALDRDHDGWGCE